MRILYGYDSTLPSTGADAEQVFQTVSSMCRAGADVELLTPGRRKGRLDGDGLRAHYQVEGDFPVVQGRGLTHGGLIFRKPAHAARVLLRARQTRPELVYTRNIPVLAAALSGGFKVVYETYRPWPMQHPQLGVLFKSLFSRPNFMGAIFHSKLARDSYRELGVAANRLEVVYNGFDPGRMEPRLSREAARKELGIRADRPVAAYVGRVGASKGLDSLLEIAKRVPQMQLLLVGSQGNGPVEKAGRKIANVAFVPWQKYDAAVKYLYAADVICVPVSAAPLEKSGSTVLPLKLFQYLATRRAILGPDLPDSRELLRHEENALLVKPGDYDGGAAAMRRLLGDSKLAGRLADQAFEDAQALTWDARGKKVVELCEEWMRTAG